MREGTKTADTLRTLYWIALVLAVIGAINWGLVGLFRVDLVATIFGGAENAIARVVYVLVGLAGIVLALTSFRAETPHPHSAVPTAR